MNLIDKLKAGVKNVKQTAWPGMEDKISLRVITEDEILQAACATEQVFKKKGLDFTAGISDIYRAEQNTQLLSLALLDESGKPLFKSADDLRPLLISGVKDKIIEELDAFQDECSPSLAALTPAQYEELFEDVKKNPSITSNLNLRTLRELIIYSVSRPAPSPKASGSTSS